MGRMAPSTIFQDLPRAGCPGLDHRIQQDPAQRTPEDSGVLTGVHPSTRKRQPWSLAPGPSSAASIAPRPPQEVSDLSRIPAPELDRFIQDHLMPSSQFQKQVSKAIDVILRGLRENCVHKPSRASKVSLAGAGTNGTLRRDHSGSRRRQSRDTGHLWKGTLLDGEIYLSASFFFFNNTFKKNNTLFNHNQITSLLSSKSSSISPGTAASRPAGSGPGLPPTFTSSALGPWLLLELTRHTSPLPVLSSRMLFSHPLNSPSPP